MNIDYFIDRVAVKVFCLVFLIFSLADIAAAQPGSTVQQGLVVGSPVSEEVQQKMGLVTLRMGGKACSGALIRQSWILTAAHCVESGGRTLVADSVDITLRGTSRFPQQRKSVEIITFRPNDVAIIRVQTPFNGDGFGDREIYTGDMKNMTVRLFGAGINEFSSNGNPSKFDGLYRDGVVDIDYTTATTFGFTAKGVMVAGGDSGGPSFVKGRSSSAFGATDMIAGVHSLCETKCAEGKDCGDGAPNPWQWVSSTPSCTDASIAPVWPKILKLLEPSFLNQTFDTSSNANTFNILYAVSQDGALNWFRHDIKYPNGKNGGPTNTLSPPKTIGSGWAGGFRDVMAMGQLGIYGLTEDGTLRWNWHLGFADGSFRWLDSRDIAKGLTGFTQIVAQDQGVLYGRIQGDPGIFWGITSNYDSKKGPPSTAFQMRLTSQTINFAAFKTMFAGGNGVLYAIDYQGNLLWMKHNLYQSPIPDPGIRMPGNAMYQLWMTQWSGPVVIGSGLTNVTKAFSPGEGHIYYVTDSGALVWRQHVGWKDGTNKWGDPNWNVIANGWGSYKFAFARNTTSDAGSGNPLLEIVVH